MPVETAEGAFFMFKGEPTYCYGKNDSGQYLGNCIAFKPDTRTWAETAAGIPEPRTKVQSGEQLSVKRHITYVHTRNYLS